ncbi:MAG TPA: sigma-70 family RNA polymerase sigma factor [Planctomycetota bacterium]
MTPPPDHELLQQLDWVRSLAARLVFDRSQRDDLEQEIWHAALRSPARQGPPLRAWLTGIGKHLAALLHRRDARRRRREQAAVRTGAAKSAAEVAEHAELQQRLLTAVNALPEPMRDVVLLRFVEGLPPRAIAEQLRVPVATVRTRQQRAMERLRERLDADFGDRRAWALPFAALARPREVAAAAGAFTTFTQLGLAVMHTNKLLAAAAALLALAAIPTAIAWSASTSAAPDTRHGEVAAALPAAVPSPAPGPAAVANAREPAAAPVRAFRGRVVDANRKPLAGATVRKAPVQIFASRVEAGALQAGDVAAQTAGDGTFTLNEAGSRNGELPIAAELDGFITREETTPCAIGTDTTIVMLRTHEVPLVVECVERTSRAPAPYFRVTGSTVLQTRSNGRVEQPVYELRVPDRARATNGTWRGTARFVEGLPFVVQVCLAGHGAGPFGQGTDPRLRAALQPVPGAPLHAVVEFDSPHADATVPRTQRGRIVADATNQPIAGVDVFHVARSGNETRFGGHVQSRADGTFALALPDGALSTLHAEHDDWQTETLAPKPDAELVVRLRPRASLKVKVVDRLGAPVPGAHVLVRAVQNERFHHRARTDTAGTIALTGLLADRYTVYLVPNDSAPDEKATTSASYSIAPGQHVEATLELEPAAAVPVTGRITGAPAGLTAAYLPYESTGRFAQARLSGASYDAGALRPGDYAVLLLAANDDDDHLPKALLPKVTVRGPGPQGIDLALPAGFVRGRVATSREQKKLRVLAVPELPPGGIAADLLARDKTTVFLGAPLASDGGFELKHIADGRWLLQLRDGATVVAQRAITVLGSLDVGDWTIDR